MTREIKPILWVSSVTSQAVVTLKKVGSLPVEGGDDLKQTNEIGMFIPVMDTLDIDGHTITGDALLTQRKLASYLINRHAHYVFIAKDNQPTLTEDIRVLFENRESADYTEPFKLSHGRFESRSISEFLIS